MSNPGLPHARSAVVADRKVRDYLLDSTHKGNQGKAGFFFRFGFNRQQWPLLRDALQAHPVANPVVHMKPNPYGTRYTVRCSLVSPDARNPCITTIWVIDPSSNTPQFVTAFP